MQYFEVAPTQIVRTGSDTFTYSSETMLSVGQLVRVSVGKKILTGIVIRPTSKPKYEVKPIEQLLEDRPLPERIVTLAVWLSEYYIAPLAACLQTVLPAGLHKKRRDIQLSSSVVKRQRTHFILNKEQRAAVAVIGQSEPGSLLLHGVTGSGKTAVYIAAAQKTISNGKSVIILVPEIALTAQVVAEFNNHFQNVLVTHSRQTEAERHSIWRKALHSEEPCVVIGPRSALFMPVPKLGLIVIDEAHEPSYKQEQSPRYHALRAAHFLAQSAGAVVVLGSATPSIVDYYLASASPRPILSLPRKAVASAHTPSVQIIDMTKRTHFSKHRFLSNQALALIEQELASGHQVLVFHNRRGSAPTTLCDNCGWQAGCPRCFVPLTLHVDHHQMRCHICSFATTVPTSCPECANASIVHKGIGTKLIESELTKLFPKHSVARFDGDSSSDQTVDSRYRDLYDGSIDIIIGTQVIAKGLDLPNLRSVIVVQGDAGLSLPDYTSPERTFQLLAQVVGRVGRSDQPTNVVVQSYQPTHPAITLGLAQDYQGFYELALQQRKRGLFPPYRYLLKLQCSYKTEAAAIRNAQQLAAELRNHLPEDVTLLGPTPAFYERAGGTYRWQLVVKSPKRSHLQALLPLIPAKYWQYELDPLSLL